MSSQICDQCGGHLPLSTVFCPHCGKEVTARFCGYCGTQVIAGARFCQNCGKEAALVPRMEKRARVSEAAAGKRTQMSLKVRLAVALPMLIALAVVAFNTLSNPDLMTYPGTIDQGTAPSVTTQVATTPTAVAPVSTTPSKTSSSTPSSAATDKTLSEIMGLAAGITSVRYDMLITGSATPSTTTKIWIKNNRMRMEIPDQGIIMLMDMDARTMYTYMPAQNMAVQAPLDLSQMPKTSQGQAEDIMNSNPEVTGLEIIDGKTCSIVECSQAGTTVTSWIWQDKGFVLRTVSVSGGSQIVTDYQNVDFSDIPDSMFVLPSGVNIISS